MKTKFAEDEYKLVGKILYIIAVSVISCGNKSYMKIFKIFFLFLTNFVVTLKAHENTQDFCYASQ